MFSLKRKSLVWVTVSCLSAGVLLAGCGASSDSASQSSASASATTAEKRTVSTAFGDVEIPNNPKSVVALEGATGPVLAAGITPKATADGDNPESLLSEEYQKTKSLPVVLGPDGWDYEAIAAQKPDLIIGFVRAGKEEKLSPEATKEYERLKKIGPTVLLRAEGSAQTKEANLEIARVLNSDDKAEEAKKAYNAKAEELKTKYADKLEKYTFAPIDHFEGVVTVYTPISWMGGIITDMGGKLDPVSAKETGVNGVDLSTEELSKLSKDSLILTEQTVDGKPGIGAQELAEIPTYTSLPAVKAHHAYGVEYFFADRYETGLKVLEQLDEILAKA